MRSSITRLLPVAVAAALALTACGGGDDAFDEADGSGSGSGSGGGASGELVVGGAQFTEMQVMQEMYAALLEDAGFDVTLQSVDNREVYAPALEAGDIDVVPEYAATMAEYLNLGANGPDAEPIATADAQETVEAMRPLAEELGLEVLEPAEAASQNGFAVTQAFADENGITTLSELGELGQPLVLAATEECPERPFCEPGLEQTYGLDITQVLPLGFGSLQTKQAVADGDAQLGLVGTTDATLDDLGLVLLEDDQQLQLADNLVPVVNADVPDEVADVLGQLSDVLTTDDLAELNRLVDAERQQPADVARDYLVEKGLIEG